MIRRWALSLSAMLCLAGLALAVRWYLPDSPLPARFAHQDCHRLALDGPDGPITGAEDLAWDAEARILYISAHDRLAVDRAISAGTEPPTGGLYALREEALTPPGPARPAPLLTGADLPGGVRPHGIALGAEHLYLINRTYPLGRQSVAIWALDTATGTAVPVQSGPELCAANDLAWRGPGHRLAVTLDRQTCPGTSWREMAFGGATGRVAMVSDAGTAPFNASYRFPNGIAVTPSGLLWTAETRGARISDVPPRWQPWQTDGGPDNLTLEAFEPGQDDIEIGTGVNEDSNLIRGPWGDWADAANGNLVAAVHPDLLKLGLYRNGWVDRAPSRAVRLRELIPKGIPQYPDVLFDDPAGTLFSGVSVAVLTGGRLILGSVRDAGLLVCRT